MSSDLQAFEAKTVEALMAVSKTMAHFAWVDSASAGDTVGHILAKHSLTVSGNLGFLKRFHAALHAEGMV